MAVNRGSVPLLDQVLAERKGKPLTNSAKSKIRMALLRGEQLSNRDVPGDYGVSITALNDAVKDLQRVGYKFDREESAEGGAIWWVTNRRHLPKVDSGPTRARRPRAEKKEPIVVGEVFVVCRAELDGDGSVSYLLRREDGRELLAIEN